MTSFRTAAAQLAGADTSDATLLNLIRYAADATDAELAQLARGLAASGDMLPPSDRLSSDVASTGGPSSLSTLLCPLQLVTLGFEVPKLGVEGRPAGGIDVLATIPGYSVDLNANDAERVLREHGYVHLLAHRLAPLDQRLFQLRKETGRLWRSRPRLPIALLTKSKLSPLPEYRSDNAGAPDSPVNQAT